MGALSVALMSARVLGTIGCTGLLHLWGHVSVALQPEQRRATDSHSRSDIERRFESSVGANDGGGFGPRIMQLWVPLQGAGSTINCIRQLKRVVILQAVAALREHLLNDDRSLLDAGTVREEAGIRSQS